VSFSETTKQRQIDIEDNLHQAYAPLGMQNQIKPYSEQPINGEDRRWMHQA
jgi:hypothetical protein